MLTLFCVTALAQEKEDRTLLTTEQTNAVINEGSGERVMRHVLELVPILRQAAVRGPGSFPRIGRDGLEHD